MIGLSSPAAARALNPPRDALATLGPERGLAAQIRHLASTWPAQHAIAVVTAAGAGALFRGGNGRAGDAPTHTLPGQLGPKAPSSRPAISAARRSGGRPELATVNSALA